MRVFFFSRLIFSRVRRGVLFFPRSLLSIFLPFPDSNYKTPLDSWEFNPEWLFTNVNSLSKLESDYKFGRRQSFRSVIPPCRGRAMGEGQGGNGRWKKVRMRSPVTKELMRGESRASRLPDMHNSVWFEICIRTWWSLTHLGTLWVTRVEGAYR